MPYCAQCGAPFDGPPQGPSDSHESNRGGGGRGFLGLLLVILGGVVLFLPLSQSGGGATDYWQAHDLCSSGIGILGSALSGSFASSCSAVNLIWAGSLLAIGIGVVLLLSGLFTRGQAPRAPAPRPECSSPQAGVGPAASLPPATDGRTYPAWGVLLGVAVVIALIGIGASFLQGQASGGCTAAWQVSGANAYVDVSSSVNGACSQPPDSAHDWVPATSEPAGDRLVCQGSSGDDSLSVYDSGFAIIGNDICSALQGSPGSS